VAEEGPIVSGIAGRYASALFDLAVEQGAVDRVKTELESFDQSIQGSEDLQRLVRNPVFSAEQQVAAVGALLERGGIGGLTANFLKLVATRRRLFAVRDMVRAFVALAEARAGVVRAEVSVADPMSAHHRKAVVDMLSGITGKQVTVTEVVNPALIGGIVVKLGSRMVDASVRTKLNSLKVAMKEVG
jgi:F-type H+-transporting ATPase subunit delta